MQMEASSSTSNSLFLQEGVPLGRDSRINEFTNESHQTNEEEKEDEEVEEEKNELAVGSDEQIAGSNLLIDSKREPSIKLLVAGRNDCDEVASFKKPSPRQQVSAPSTKTSQKPEKFFQGSLEPPRSIERERTKVCELTINNKISYYNYKQTGVKSRPVKLLKHPVEHYQQKLIFNFIIGLLFKLIAILTGPIIVLAAYLVVLPIIIVRRSCWFLLNLSFLFDAKIKTTTTDDNKNNPSSNDDNKHHDDEYENFEAEDDNDWNYCPLSYLEAFWFKKKLVNNAILVIDELAEENSLMGDEHVPTPFAIDKFRETIRESILCKPTYRKFLCRVKPIGIPFYKSYFWQRLELANTIPLFEDLISVDERGSDEERYILGKKEAASKISSQTKEKLESSSPKSCESSQEFSISGSYNSNGKDMIGGSDCGARGKAKKEIVQILMSQNEPPMSMRASKGGAAGDGSSSGSSFEINGEKKSSSFREDMKVYLSDHIYIDSYLIRNGSGQDRDKTERARIRRYAYSLMEVNLDMTRPLWEIRVVPSKRLARFYLIFRCHQSLADGHSLASILTDHLTVSPTGLTERNIPKSELLNVHHQTGFNEEENNRPCQQPQQHVSSNAHGSNLNLTHSEDSDELDDKSYHTNANNEQLLDKELQPIGEKRSFVSKVSKSSSHESSVLIGPLTVLLWVIWTFTRRKSNHLNKCLSISQTSGRNQKIDSERSGDEGGLSENKNNNQQQERRLYMTHYDLTKFHRIKQMTKSTVSDVILCALSGALRDYLRKFNGVSNPPTLNASLTVNMRQESNTRIGSAANKTNKQRALESNQDCCQTTIRVKSNPSQAQTLNTSIESASNVDDRQEGNSVIMMESQAQQKKQQQQQQQLQLHQTTTRRHQEPQVNCTLVNVPLPTSIEGTIPRLWELRATMNELRSSADPWVMLDLQRFLFLLLPTSWYQWLIKFIVLRNSSIFVSNIRGPVNMVESWCVDIFQRAVYESQQPPKRVILGEGIEERDDYQHYGDQLDDLLPTTKQANYIDTNTASDKLMSKYCKGEASSQSKLNQGSNFSRELNFNGKHKLKLKAKEKENQELETAVKARKSVGKLRLINKLGSLSAIYYCMQPPTSEIPISFNCITYHNKLFITSMSRSLLVEDSKLLIKLFFAQLNQLANTIAKRKNFFTIVRTPIPIEISCQPASPILDKSMPLAAQEDNSHDEFDKQIQARENSITSSETGPNSSEETDDDQHEHEAVDAEADADADADADPDVADNDEVRGTGFQKTTEIKTERPMRGAGESNKRASQRRTLGHRARIKLKQDDNADPGAHSTGNRAKPVEARLNATKRFQLTNQSNEAAKTAKLSPHSPASIQTGNFQRQQHYQQQFMKDDIEANLGSTSNARKCSKCHQFVCTCRRRKSLFSLDLNQRSVNLLSLLHPNYYFASGQRSKSTSNEASELSQPQQQQQLTAECLCGRQLLEELDEDVENGPINNYATTNSQENLRSSDQINQTFNRKGLSRESIRSRTPSDDGGRHHRSSRVVGCAKCRYNSARSLISLSDNQDAAIHSNRQFNLITGAQQQQSNHNRKHQNKKSFQHKLGQHRDQNNELGGSNNSISSGVGSSSQRHNSAILNIPTPTTSSKYNSPKVSKCYSKSENDLLPFNKKSHRAGSGGSAKQEDSIKGNEQPASNTNTASKESWFVLNRKGNRRISTIFPRSAFNSSFKIRRTFGSSSPVSAPAQSRGRNLIGTSIDLISNHMPSRRRQSVATTTGASSNILRSIVVKDETNADVNLRYHLDGSILGIRNRRFSTIGSAVVSSSQRRSSLIPFGLMNNQAFPKLFWDDEEAHL